MLNRRSSSTFAMAVLALCAGLVARGGAQRGTLPQTGTGLIAGRVTEGNTTRPVPGATVVLLGSGQPRVVGADEQGRFYFAGLPPGSFQINASRHGYNQISAFLDRPVALAAGERRADVALRLVKQGSLAGVVRDDGGDPVVGTDVVAFRRVLTNGRWSLRRVGQARTDDRGAYRITGLDPADYVICACSRDPIPFDGVLLTTIASEPLQLMGVAARALSRGADVAELDATLRTYAPTFFGNSATTAQAARVAVASGDEKSGLDITTPVVLATRVSGRVVGGPVSASNLMLVPAGNAGIEGAIAAIPPMLVQADGRFDFAGVPPGPYVVRVVPRGGRGGGGMSGAALAFLGARAADVARPPAPPSAADAGSALWAEEPITVSDRGATDVIVALRPTLSLTGRVVIEGPPMSAPAADPMLPVRSDAFAQVNVGLQPVANDPARFSPAVARAAADGSFTVTGLVPGRYSVTATPPRAATSLRSVMLGGTDVTDLAIEIGAANTTDLVLTYAGNTVATLQGSIEGFALTPNAAVTVLVFSADRRYWADPVAARRRFRAVAPSRDGSFIVPLAPGEYLVCAVPDEAAVDWQEMSRLDVLARTAQRVVAVDGTRTTVMVKR
ncbi:MAG TPA: carboxypeptidase regulatory-like domain-containing protein [Vicinamibacterales bacterium]|nr:carboxypeptidase regulatory-like domain-containing protein [Vicinamibacterales bacterium]